MLILELIRELEAERAAALAAAPDEAMAQKITSLQRVRGIGANFSAVLVRDSRRGIVQHRAVRWGVHATSFRLRARTGIVKSSALTAASHAALPTTDQSSGPVARPRVISTRW